MEAELYNERPLNIQLNPNARDFLRNTAKWGRFLAITGFVFFGMMILGGVMSLWTIWRGNAITAAALGNSLMSGGVFSIFYLVMTLLYFFPLLYLHRFSTKMIVGLNQNDEVTVTNAFQNLKSLFKLLGILTIVMLAVYAFMVIAATAGAYFGSSRF